MREDLRELNKINNKARMMAGYCYDWVTKNNPNADVYDIKIGDDFKAKWNLVILVLGQSIKTLLTK